MTHCIKSGKHISRGSKLTTNARKLNVLLIHVKSICRVGAFEICLRKSPAYFMHLPFHSENVE
ncbi:hypothetical protein T4B_15027 [Trichinella pseudospiralis]|uniref:Uncharacterized protein n=1 Tax=Trichinella pseudospiralis TaxID=6337 RepID=A0A0V1GI39_TRIPS|nr:hypothetical protein T4B_15027 [Trichinella pseudospiralis]